MADTRLQMQLEHIPYLTCLSPKRRQTLLLVTFGRRSYETAAQLLDCGINTVKSRMSRARADMRNLVEHGTPLPLETIDSWGTSFDLDSMETADDWVSAAKEYLHGLAHGKIEQSVAQSRLDSLLYSRADHRGRSELEKSRGPG